MDRQSTQASSWGSFVAQHLDEVARLTRASCPRGTGNVLYDREDVVQEVVLRLLRASKSPCFSSAAERRAYLRRAVSSVLVDRSRRRSAAKRGGGEEQDRLISIERHGSEPIGRSGPDAEAALAQREVVAILVRAGLRASGSRQRRDRDLRVVWWAWVERRTSREISVLLGEALSPSSVESLLSRFRRAAIRGAAEVLRYNRAA